MAAEAKAQAQTLDGSSTFNLNDRVNTFLMDGFDIPKRQLTEAGKNRKRRGQKLKEQHYKRLEIPIPFSIEDTDKGLIANRRDSLTDIISQERWVFIWNPDPDDCSDVYFDCYSAFVKPAYDRLYRVADDQMHLIEALADPLCRDPAETVFDSTTVLAETDGETGEWTGANGYTTDPSAIYGTLSSKITTTAGATWTLGWMERNAATPLALPEYLTTGWVSGWVFTDGAQADLDHLTIKIRIGSDSNNYRQWDISSFFGGWGQIGYLVPGWQELLFDFNSPDSVVGTPNFNSYAYFRFEVYSLFQILPSITFKIDNFIINNGKVSAARARTPFVCTVYDIGGKAPAGFLADIEWSSSIDKIWLGRKYEGVTPFPAVVDTPEDPAPTGFATTPAVDAEPDCHNGDYYRYSVSSAGLKIFPGKFWNHQHKGNFKKLVRFRSYDGGTISIRWCGYDKNGDFGYGDRSEERRVGKECRSRWSPYH